MLRSRIAIRAATRTMTRLGYIACTILSWSTDEFGAQILIHPGRIGRMPRLLGPSLSQNLSEKMQW